MTKSLMKQLVSVGSASALAAASLIGFSAPANAAAGLNISVAEGSGFTFVEGSAPVFTISGNSDFIASNGSQLRVQLTNVDAVAAITATAINGTTLDSNYVGGLGNSVAYATTTTGVKTNNNAGGTLAALSATTAGSKTVFGLGSSATTLSVATSASAMTSPFTFTFTSGAVANDTTDTFLLTAFADADNDGVVDAGELQETVTVTFIASEDVTTTVTSATPLDGGNSFDATLTSNVNIAYQTAARYGIYVKDNADAAAKLIVADAGTAPAVAGVVDGGDAYFALNTAKTKWTVTINPSTGATTTGLLSTSGDFSAFTLQGAYDHAGSVVVADVVGTAITARVGAVSVSAADSIATVVRSANAKQTSDAATTGTTETADVRKNTEFTVLADFEDSSGDNVVGKAVAFTFDNGPVLSSSKTVTVNGTAYTSQSDLEDASIAATTNASGRASVTVSTTGFSAAETLRITATADGIAEAVTATARTAAYTADLVEGSLVSNTGYGKTIAVGGTLPVRFAVADQWGIAPDNGVQRVSLSRATATSRTTAANWSYTLPVVDGFATGSIVDNGAGAGSDTMTATLSGTDGSGTDTFTLTYATAVSSDVASMQLTDNQGTGDSTIRLDADSLPSYHPFLNNAASAPLADASNFKNGATTGASDTLLAVSGTALNAAGVGVAGKTVTLSASGLTFEFTDGAGNEIYSRDSISVPTTAGGAFSVNVRSDGKGGATVITATSNGQSATTTVTFENGNATGMDLSVPATAADGRAIDIIATLTDVAGDPVSGVSVSFTATGVGYLSNLSGTSNANGQVVVKLITQSGETGTANITATATLDGVSTSQSATLTVGESSTTDQKVNAGSFKGYVAVYAKGYEGDRLSFKAGNDWNVTESLASDFERVVEFTGAGYTISVPIYINRVLVDTIVVTTK